MALRQIIKGLKDLSFIAIPIRAIHINHSDQPFIRRRTTTFLKFVTLARTFHSSRVSILTEISTKALQTPIRRSIRVSSVQQRPTTFPKAFTSIPKGKQKQISRRVCPNSASIKGILYLKLFIPLHCFRLPLRPQRRLAESCILDHIQDTSHSCRKESDHSLQLLLAQEIQALAFVSGEDSLS